MGASVSGNVALTGTTSEPNLAAELAKLNLKLDALGEQVGHLYRRTVALEELKDELVPILRDSMSALGTELQEIESEFNSDEIAALLRKLLRNTPVFIRLLDRLESLDSFVVEVEPLGKQVVRDLIDRLQLLEERGYFRLLRGMDKLLERIASHATQEDVDRLADNVVYMVDTFKRMTQPEMLAKTNDALKAMNAAREGRKTQLGLWGLLRASRDPEIQEGLGVLMELTRQLGRRDADAASALENHPNLN